LAFFLSRPPRLARERVAHALFLPHGRPKLVGIAVNGAPDLGLARLEGPGLRTKAARFFCQAVRFRGLNKGNCAARQLLLRPSDHTRFGGIIV
jgi:hypothetical protein